MRGKNSDADVVSYAEAEKLAKDIGAVCYIESSARTRKGVDEVFQKAIDINVKKGCEIM